MTIDEFLEAHPDMVTDKEFMRSFIAHDGDEVVTNGLAKPYDWIVEWDNEDGRKVIACVQRVRFLAGA